MEQTSITSPPAVEIVRTFPASRERVFRAWTVAKEFEQWFKPAPDYDVLVPVLEARVGGRYLVEMRNKDGAVHSVAGNYRTMQPPEEISFTWRWLDNEAAGESLVTIRFRELGTSTEVRVFHELLPTAEERERHAHGWNGCFEQLAHYL